MGVPIMQVDPAISEQSIRHLPHPSVKQGAPEDYPFFDEIDKLNPNKAQTTTKAFWTDMFLYWLDDTYVQEGSYIAFFSDIQPERTIYSICFR